MHLLQGYGTFGCKSTSILLAHGVNHAETVFDVIHSAVAKAQTEHPEALVLISGDFNHVTLTTHWLLFTSKWTVTPEGRAL